MRCREWIFSFRQTLQVDRWSSFSCTVEFLLLKSSVCICRNSFSLEISSQGFFAMGRGRGKAKKQNVIAAREDTGSGEEERILPSRRRGRPQKTLKDDIVEGEEALKTEDGEDAKSHVSSKDMKGQSAIENGRKRKRSAQVKETVKSVKEDKMIETKSSLDDPKKSVGFRQNGSRRKNKPHRAAEAGVECQ